MNMNRRTAPSTRYFSSAVAIAAFLTAGISTAQTPTQTPTSDPPSPGVPLPAGLTSPPTPATPTATAPPTAAPAGSRPSPGGKTGKNSKRGKTKANKRPEDVACSPDGPASQCGSDEFCAVGAGLCGTVPGQCQSMGDMCHTRHDPVCGCDGNTYDNASCAHAAGVNVASKGACR